MRPREVVLVEAGADAAESTTFDESLSSAVDAAIAAMDWLEDADRGIVTMARTHAAAIDAILANPKATPTEVTKALYLGPHLVACLREMGGTPAARGVVGAGEKAADPVEEALKNMGRRPREQGVPA